MNLGYYIFMVLLLAGVAYNLTNGNKPRPALSGTRKTIAIICFSVAGVCGLLLFAAIAISSHGSAH